MALVARDLMIRDVGVVDVSADLETLERCFAEAGVSGFPVVEGDKVVGVVSRADVLRSLGGLGASVPRLSHFYADLGAFEAEETLESFAEAAARGAKRLPDLRVADLVTREIVAVGPDTPLQQMARTLAEHGVHRALVVDDGTLVGIISALDIVRLVGEGRLAAT